MSTYFYSERKVHRTRKAHHCDGCDGTIEAGSPAVTCAGHADGDFYACYYHDDCRSAEKAWNAERGTFGDEWCVISYLVEEPESFADLIWLRRHYPLVFDRLKARRRSRS